MNRRTFLKTLLFSAASLPFLTIPGNSAENDPESSASEILLQTSTVAGFQFYDGQALWPALQVGDTIRLEPEPSNPHDPKAVKVMWWDKQLGYLPRWENSTVFQMLSRGEHLTARIHRLQEQALPWERITIQISIVRGRKTPDLG